MEIPQYKKTKTRTDKIHSDLYFRRLELCSSKYTYYTKQLENNFDLIHNYSQKHSQVILIRCDIHYPTDYEAPEDNYQMSRFTDEIKALYKAEDPVYFYCRDKKNSKNQHYHCYFIFRADRHDRVGYYTRDMNRIWCDILNIERRDGLVIYEFGEFEGEEYPNGIKIQRTKANAVDEFKRAVKWCSYLAKVETKDGKRKFACSPIPRFE